MSIGIRHINKMKVFIVLALLAVAVYGAEEKKEETKAATPATPAADGERPKTFKRLIPADVLRGKKSAF